MHERDWPLEGSIGEAHHWCGGSDIKLPHFQVLVAAQTQQKLAHDKHLEHGASVAVPGVDDVRALCNSDPATRNGSQCEVPFAC